MILLADANLPVLPKAFPKGFDIVTYANSEELKEQISMADVLLCRSTLSVDKPLLEGTHVRMVATASSGTNHIDTSYLRQNNIRLITAIGANASAVCDWVLSVFAHIQPKLSGRCLGIIGYGHVGSQLQRRFSLLNYKVLTCDPLIHQPPNFVHIPLEKLSQCDAIFIHANFHADSPFPSKNLIDQHFLASLKSSCFIINASRGGIVNEEEILNTPFCHNYCTDVFENEPNINAKIVDTAFLCTPHIAGHTVEAKVNAVFQVSREIHRVAKLPIPPMSASENQLTIDLTQQTWSHDLLNHYDPVNESILLKSAKDKSHAFLTLRKAHLRHGFDVFALD
ncbi:NAD(P)-dependent oxidoreductase [Legionella sp. W05-934-2]|jgi:erythronate-4-phosphate dehydrogenase|uniref:NAD(P)-dependent oxidoreductase n=1 Tax=Legionella sp. W05-934-2 TaxID=1198649 RepID=UPI0034619250